jgi:hypothetical protein
MELESSNAVLQHGPTSWRKGIGLPQPSHPSVPQPPSPLTGPGLGVGLGQVACSSEADAASEKIDPSNDVVDEASLRELIEGPSVLIEIKS